MLKFFFAGLCWLWLLAAHAQPQHKADTVFTAPTPGVRAQQRFMELHPGATGEVLPAAFNLLDVGRWDTLAAGTVFRAVLSVEQIAGLGLMFSRCSLPTGTELRIFAPEQPERIQVFTAASVANGERLATGHVSGSMLQVEYHAFGHRSVPLLELDGLACLYRLAFAKVGAKGFGTAGNCQINLACEEGREWAEVARAVVRIRYRIGNLIGWCTGTLLNNVREDFTPYILTAQHCALNNDTGRLTSLADFGDWLFYFGYASDACFDPETEGDLASRLMIGALPVAESDDGGGETGSDFLLLRLNAMVPESFDPVFAGWAAQEFAANRGVTIHHPRGDLKKIAFFNRTLRSVGFGPSVSNSHWEVLWSETQNGFGVTEPGSSGSPLFDEGGRLIGTLTGGFSSCIQPRRADFYGKFTWHWEQNGNAANRRLLDWLDPDNTRRRSMRSIDYNRQVVTALTTTEALSSISVLEVYPNPTQGHVYLRGLADRQPPQCTLLDLQGRHIALLHAHAAQQDEWQVELPRLSPGLYLLQVSSAGQRQHRRIFIH